MDWLFEDVKLVAYAFAIYAIALGAYWIFVG